MERNEQIKKDIAEQLLVDIEKVVPTASLLDDLGADSLDLVELITGFEERFEVVISDEVGEKLTAVEDYLNLADKLEIPK